MAIVDYELIAHRAQEKFYAEPGVSEKNKALVRRFEQAYRVSPARKGLFYRHVTRLLERTPDLERDMHDRDTINRIFTKLDAELGRSYYSTVINTSKTLARWLNDGATPKGFSDLKAVKQKDLRRGLTREDMLSWEEGVQLAAQTPSMQLKALILAQLDGGFRPSEIHSLNYGDLTVKGDVIVAHIKDGKTGSRDVILWRCVPALLKWLQAHPSKKPKDPLWIMEHADKSHQKLGAAPKRGELRRYAYFAMAKAIHRLGEKADIKKPLDFYSLRHSSCFLDKLDLVPLDLAAKKHGHSIKFFTDTYGRLDISDDVNRLRRHYGSEEEGRVLLKNRKCERCAFINEPDAASCQQCGSSLTIDEALKREDELAVLKAQVNAIAELVKAQNSREAVVAEITRRKQR